MSLIFATQLTAVATVALGAFAFIAATLAFLAYRKQSWEVGLLLQQSEREARERRVAQASRVFIWTETTDSPLVEGMQRPTNSLQGNRRAPQEHQPAACLRHHRRLARAR